MSSFAERMSGLAEAIRRQRRPLAHHDPRIRNYRRWAAAVLQAEVTHATEDFWRCACAHDAGLLFDHYRRDHEAAPFRFAHEDLAGRAALWLSHLQTHDHLRHGPWARWKVMSRSERIAWVRRRRELLHGFLRATRAYQAARAALIVPLRRAA